jgi:para-aminobenzoate synthetase/4-amino-4-deoxychorismate lyase
MRQGLWSAQSFALLDNASEHGQGLLFEVPVDAVEAYSPTEITRAFDALERARARRLHAVGFLAYELGYALEEKLGPLMPSQHALPLLSFGLFGAPRVLSEEEVTSFLAGKGTGPFAIEAPRPAFSFNAYAERFASVKALIEAGDTYQINLTFPLRFGFAGDAVALFRRLRSSARAGYGALLALDGCHVLSLSPELFVETKDGVARARPMKGTAPRAPLPEADLAQRAALKEDEKSRAENLMIVDLVRNDLGRVAETGSVRVEELFAIETYPTLHQMTSTVTAKLLPDTNLRRLVGALFPCGSVTGAPKIRAMEIIHTLEEGPRGIYCGAIGYVTPTGDTRFNVAIRTLTIDASGQGTMGVGGGLVADSKLEAEYAECLLKARFLTDEPFALLETLRWTRAEGYFLLAFHLDRLLRSARHFGFACTRGDVERRLAEAAAAFAAPNMRVRLLLDGEGKLAIDAHALPDEGPHAMRFALSERRISSAEPLLYHKTTRRDAYESELVRLKALCGADEVLFQNERGELTEGSRTNLFIERAGVLLTPPVECGLLAGTLRRALLADTARPCHEAVLKPADLETADAIYLGNSVRGLMRARFANRETV